MAQRPYQLGAKRQLNHAMTASGSILRLSCRKVRPVLLDQQDQPRLCVSVGSVTKVAPGGTPTASVTGSNGSYAINLGIPEGQQGAKGDGFTDYGNITKSGDLNDYKRTGVADIQAVMANKPAGYEWNWGVLKVFAPDNGSHHIVQEWYPSGISNGTMFFRYYTVSRRGGKWGR